MRERAQYQNPMKIIHTADLHLDSPFEALSPEKARQRRSEQRALLAAIADLARTESADLVLLAGDLLDSENSYYETGEELVNALRSIDVPVVISPGNHDYYCGRSPYARLKFPQNVYVFRHSGIECIDFSKRGFRVFGAAFTDRYSAPLLDGFSVDKKHNVVDIMCIHGDVGNENSNYNPISIEQISKSNVDYFALGHVHSASGLQKSGNTYYSYPGCPEGRGFDETGAKSVNIISIDKSGTKLATVNVAKRKYEKLVIDVSGMSPLYAIKMALPDKTVSDVYSIVLKGTADEDIDVVKLHDALEPYFFALKIKDETRQAFDIWSCSGNDTLRGLFISKLKQMYDASENEEDRKLIEQSARWGIAALDNSEEVGIYGN